MSTISSTEWNQTAALEGFPNQSRALNRMQKVARLGKKSALQAIPTYSTLCNLQMQAKRKREECGFDSLLAEDGLIKPG